MKLNIICSVANDSIIGVNNDLYVKIKDDLKYFQKITSENYYKNKQNVLIMGYNTFKSIGKPLKDRINIVISKNHADELNKKDIIHFDDLNICFQHLESNEYGKIFIIGGASIYNKVFKDYFPIIDTIHYTNVLTEGLENYQYAESISKNVSRCKIPVYKWCAEKKIVLLDFTEKCSKGLYYNFMTEMYEEKELNYTFNVFQNVYFSNNEELQYINLLKNILNKKNLKETRNANVFSEFGVRMEFDLRNGFPILTTKRVPWKTVLRELLWFISGSTDNQVLKDKNVHIWDSNSSKEFLESRGLNYKEDDLGPVYGFQWRHFGTYYVDNKTDYTGKGTDQLKYIIDEIKNNAASRRLILNSWNAADIDKMALPPCHVMVQFNIDKEFIDCQLYQRSGYMFLGVPFNITSYAFLLSIIGHITGYKPRKLIHIIGDAHIYEQHLEAVNQQIMRTPNRFPYLTISEDLNNIDTIKEEYFTIVNYDCYTTIPAPMIA